jgi:hypothetical protein
MKNLFLFIFSFCVISVFTFAQEGEMEMTEEMKVWMDYMTPGPMHEMLASANGEWDTKVTFWMMPGVEPQTSTGTTTNEMILGGRYQKTTHHGDMMGMPFEGMGLLAYDNATQKFYNIWIDNMGTGMMMSSGKFNKETNKAEMSGTFVDPMTGKEEPFKQTFEMIDENKHVFEMFMFHEGNEFKSLEIEYTRK